MKFLEQIMDKVARREPDIFGAIVGHEEIKETFEILDNSQESAAILQIGPPACAKSLFLEAMRDKHGKTACWVDGGGNASGAGTIDDLLDRPKTTALIIDEISGMTKTDQMALLVLIETGKLTVKKVRRKGEREFKNLKVYAACNNPEKLLPQFMSRFFTIHFKEYTESEFIEIATKMYPKKDPLLCEYVAKACIKVLGTKDIREYRHIILHAKDSEIADKLITVRLKHSKGKEEAQEN